MDRRHELRVKLASLAAEQRIIARTIRQLTARRRRDRKAHNGAFHVEALNSGRAQGPDTNGGFTRAEYAGQISERQARPLCRLNTDAINSLTHHAQCAVGPEARATHLASCLLRGTPYASAEATTRTVPNLKRIGDIARRFGEPGAATEAAIIAWTRAATEHLLRPEAREASWSLAGMSRATWDATVYHAARNAGVPVAEPVAAGQKIGAVEALKAT